MKTIGVGLFLLGIVLLFCSCDILKASQSITPEQQARLDALSAKEKDLQAKADELIAKQKAGTLSAADVASGLATILPAIAQTVTEIGALKKEIQAQSGSGALGTLGAILIGAFARSGLHGLSFLATGLPPPFNFVATAITGLLGGSQTHDPAPPAPTPPPKPA